MLCKRRNDQEKEPDQEAIMATQQSDVKSTAVVKFSAVEMPARFHQLQRNTNLNEPPANWLHGGSKWESYLRDLSLGRDRSFSSFKMAHCFPDLTGEIDVISDAENIKKLLKIPYGNGQISMMVHRVGNTLLLDDFDVHKHLLRKQQDDWKWLRKFYYETVLANMQEQQDKCIVKKNKSRDHLQNRNMFSKFLYYSMADSTATEGQDISNDFDVDSEHLSQEEREAISRNFVPDPLAQPSPQQTDHQRSLVWTFEDLRMLIGTDLPIFGGGTHPCVSLRLRDMRKPINILTGIDYWLDNLMCNVPELAMCYHLNGIVQRYELLKTEAIPELDNSKFSPQVIRDIAQNILSFLHANATKEGHTYWLFKGRDDDIVKLYDLSTLCKEEEQGEDRNNPFSVPVGVLMYRVARNMRQNQGRKKSGTIRTLLQNCLQLLDKERHSQVVTSAHYLLSDLYIKDDISDLSPSTSSQETEGSQGESPEDEEDEDDKSSDNTVEKPASSVEVQALYLSNSMKKTEKHLVRYPPIDGTVEQRCCEAIKHIAKGLSCLDLNASKHKPSKHVVEEQVQCDPSVVIPLHYQPLQRQRSVDSSQNSSPGGAVMSHVSLFTKTSLPSGTWHTLSKTLLMRKAALVYHGWAEHKAALGKYSQAMQLSKLALRCFCAVKNLNARKAAENLQLQSAICVALGDLHLRLLRHGNETNTDTDVDFVSDYHATVIESAMKDMEEYEFEWLERSSTDPAVNLAHARRLYEVALQLASAIPNSPESVTILSKRYGNIQNEIGVFFMNQASQLLSHQDENQVSKSKLHKLCEQSQACFSSGIEAFEKAGDKINMALLHSNLGRLMRLKAQAHMHTTVSDTSQQRREFSVEERQYFLKAVQSYKSALTLLDKRDKQPNIWDSIVWELSSTYFNMATLIQDYAPLSTMAHEQIEEEVTKLMLKALSHCDCEGSSGSQVTNQYRAATIHHRLASLCHNAFRNQVNDKKKKQLRSQTEDHYKKACHYFQLVDSSCELLRVELERVALCEYILEGQTSPISKLKTLHTALDLLLECKPALSNIRKLLTDGDSSTTTVDSADEMEGCRAEAEKLLPILETRLQFVLLNLVKNASVAKKGKCTEQLSLSEYKIMYGCVLKKSQGDSTSLAEKCSHLVDVLNELSQHVTQRQGTTSS